MNIDRQDFEKAVSLYKEWNGKINVVSRKDIDNIYEHHILHSLAIAHYITDVLGLDMTGKKVLDVGTGGGFPGIPLAMVFPQAQFTLCDSIGKKILVASSVADGLGLANVKCVNARAETLPSDYDIIVSRAVTSLDNFYPWVKSKFSDRILYLKGGDIASEVSTLCARHKVNPSLISAWPVTAWIKDEFYDEKFVVDIRRDR